jgi:hypothetical protein
VREEMSFSWWVDFIQMEIQKKGLQEQEGGKRELGCYWRIPKPEPFLN